MNGISDSKFFDKNTALQPRQNVIDSLCFRSLHLLRLHRRYVSANIVNTFKVLAYHTALVLTLIQI